MLKNLGVVHACFHLPRFRANATRKLSGRTLFEWVVRRVTDATRLDGVIVMICAAEDHQAVSRLVPRDVPIILGQGDDTLARLTHVLEQCEAEGTVQVMGDKLFVDPGLIDRLVTTAESELDCDYVGYSSHDGRPAILSPAGVYAEWFRTSALRTANRFARGESERGNTTRYLHAHPERFRVRLIPAPAAIDRDDVRLTVDLEEDWDHVLSICDALGPERLEWQRVARLLDQQPALRSRMAALNRASEPLAYAGIR
jgi:spore coat polysaccharide biosynthesis protein SpsF (cytidylyltransferase family)